MSQLLMTAEQIVNRGIYCGFDLAAVCSVRTPWMLFALGSRTARVDYFAEDIIDLGDRLDAYENARLANGDAARRLCGTTFATVNLRDSDPEIEIVAVRSSGVVRIPTTIRVSDPTFVWDLSNLAAYPNSYGVDFPQRVYGGNRDAMLASM